MKELELEGLTPKEILKEALRHFEAGHRPIPVYWHDGRVQPLDEYSDFFTKAMTKREFKKLFLDKEGELKHQIEGFGILTCKDTGIVGWDIDNKGDGKPDGFSWLKFKGFDVPAGMVVNTPHDGAHIVQTWPDDVDDLPTGDLGVIEHGDGNQVGVELKARALFIVAGPGYDRINGISAIEPANGELLDFVLDNNSEWVEEGYADEVDAGRTPEESLPSLEAAIPRRGYVHDFVDHVTTHTFVPPEFALAVGLTQMSILMAGRLGVADWRGKVVRPHIWMLLVAPPASGKTTAWEIALEGMLDRVASSLQIPADQTPESLLHWLATEQSRGYMLFSEFGGFLAKSAGRAYQAGDKQDLSNMFDTPREFTRKTLSGGKIIIRNPSFTIAGGLTRSNFEQYIRAEDMNDGFLTRFLFVFLEHKLPARGLKEARAGSAERKKLTDELASRYQFVKDLWRGREHSEPVVEVELSPMALFHLDRFSKHVMEMDVESVLTGFRGRLPQYGLKLALCYALSRTKPGEELKVMEADIRHAVSFLEYQRSRAWPVVGQVAGMQDNVARQLWRVRIRLQEMMKEAAGPNGKWTEMWVSTRTLLMNLHMSKRQFDGHIETLVEAGQAKTRTRERPFKKDKLGRRASGRGEAQVQLTPAGWITDTVA